MIKPGVVFYGIQPEMVVCDGIVEQTFQRYSLRCTRTSIVGKKHGSRSLHPVGFAVDYRTRHIAGSGRLQTITMLVDDLKAALPCCDIVFEHEGEPQEHIHVEYDPKDDPFFQRDKAVYRETGEWPKRKP